jgi:hypothetical protein
MRGSRQVAFKTVYYGTVHVGIRQVHQRAFTRFYLMVSGCTSALAGDVSWHALQHVTNGIHSWNREELLRHNRILSAVHDKWNLYTDSFFDLSY